MVQFGRRLLALQYEPWKSFYFDYNLLKGILQAENNEPVAHVEREFVRQLNMELEKTVLFFLSEQGGVASRLTLLREKLMECSAEIRQDSLAAESSGTESLIRRKLSDLSDAFRSVGEDLVHLIHFVELSVTGVRKILKKHDKLYKANKLSHRYLSEHYWDAEDSHLRQLYHYEGIGAIVATLQESFREIRALEALLNDRISGKRAFDGRPRRTHTAPDMLLLQETAVEHVEAKRQPVSSSYHSRTGGGHMKTSTTIDGAIADWQEHLSQMQEPILLKIDAARRRLRESSTYVSVLASSAMIEQPPSEEELMEVEIPSPLREKASLSRFLNYMSTFLYMSGYYIVAPTGGAYAEKLGSHAALAGLIIGMTPIAALASTVLYSWWTSYSYKSALIFASACSIVGNLLYALGLPFQSIELVMLGRLMNGFGGARAINRRYIADSFSRDERTAASATFVTAGALGMAAGPAMATLFEYSPSNTIWSPENAPGWFMCAAWTLFLIALIFGFENPPRARPTSGADVEMTGEKAALLSNGGEENKPVVEKPDRSPPLWKNVPVMATLAVAFVLKFTLECILSSTANLSGYYFGWGAQESGLYLAVLGLLMFPANLVVAYYSRQYDDRELIFASLALMLVGVWGILNYGGGEDYSLAQYIAFGIVIFVSANALEGPNMSLLSKTIPTSWAKGIFNVGLLVTESGTFGRAVADVFITWCGLYGIDHLLNNMFATLGVLVALTLAFVYQVYGFLEPSDKDE